jgi:DNA-directed RNA polymerase subunit M/transcription elongation factor TFIIS
MTSLGVRAHGKMQIQPEVSPMSRSFTMGVVSALHERLGENALSIGRALLTYKVQCPLDECSGDRAFYQQRQIRSADEPMTTFYQVRLLSTHTSASTRG